MQDMPPAFGARLSYHCLLETPRSNFELLREPSSGRFGLEGISEPLIPICYRTNAHPADSETHSRDLCVLRVLQVPAGNREYKMAGSPMMCFGIPKRNLSSQRSRSYAKGMMDVRKQHLHAHRYWQTKTQLRPLRT